jgi:hypothetical protein
VPHALHRGLDVHRAFANLFEQRAQLILIHTLREYQAEADECDGLRVTL